MTPPRSLWRPALVALLLMALSFVRALSWQWIDQASPQLQLTPRGEHLLTAVALSVPLFPAAALLWSAITRRLQTRLAVVLVLLVVLGAGGGVFARFAWVPFFDGEYLTQVASPDGLREAHLRMDGFLGCRASVYVAPHGGLWGELAAQRSVECDDDAGARWLPDGGVEVTGAIPRPLDLYLGPH